MGPLNDVRFVTRLHNFRVADHHTYFVGCDDWGFAVWVHNASAFHYTRQAGVNGMNASRKIKASQTKYTKHGVTGEVVWLTPLDPKQLKAKGVTKLGLTRAKAEYVVEVEVPDELIKTPRGGRGEYIWYVTEDIALPSKGTIGTKTDI